MPKSQPRSRANPAQVRGDIDRGSTGDKLPGFDPAAAPLETDAEAAREPLSPAQVDASRKNQPKDGASRNEGSHGPALRPFDRSREERSPVRRYWLPVVLAAIVLALLATVLLT